MRPIDDVVVRSISVAPVSRSTSGVVGITRSTYEFGVTYPTVAPIVETVVEVGVFLRWTARRTKVSLFADVLVNLIGDRKKNRTFDQKCDQYYSSWSFFKENSWECKINHKVKRAANISNRIEIFLSTRNENVRKEVDTHNENDRNWGIT